jgi:hypothetical protein
MTDITVVKAATAGPGTGLRETEQLMIHRPESGSCRPVVGR